ncbi:hypothetical protein RHSIM_Rhsim07G0188000 [Rhododendron simsii]|uniref:Uncharacterized protein n=1 Tax=Rhododendron simsii TaxID=118357 RepID=A0A834GMA2_RHOSS|nr:hypothetical protein RHSIM_Rhsim07G0188000 [Rhododendron simsii]
MSTVVISSDKVAWDMFKNHDVVLAGRKTNEAMKGEYGTDGSLILEQYGPKWRTMRRLCTTEFFAKSRLNAMEGVRSRCIDQMVQFITDAGASGTIHRREELLLHDDFQSYGKPHVLERSLGPQIGQIKGTNSS